MSGMILEKIIQAKRARIEAAKERCEFYSSPSKSQPHRFRDALAARTRPNIIAEFKRASPSKGVINDALSPVDVARNYRDGGAAAISVLTEEDFFNGSLDDLRAVREAVDLPILRKDFIVDEFQIRESEAAGADAILLIVAVLGVDELRRFQSLAQELGLDVLVEVHNEEEMETAASIGSTLIGVNNRSLHTFKVSLDVSRRLARVAPPDVILIAESGIKTRDDIRELYELGYSGFLIGETLMRTGDPKMILEGLASGAGGNGSSSVVSE